MCQEERDHRLPLPLLTCFSLPTGARVREFLTVEKNGRSICAQLGNQHRNPGNAAYDLGILRIAKRPDGHRRHGGRDKQQAASVVVAPTASVAIVAKLDKVDGTVVFAWPHVLDDLVLMRINLNECTGPDQRIERVVLGPDVSIKYVPYASVVH